MLTLVSNFAGRIHVVVVHFPLALILFTALLELVSWRKGQWPNRHEHRLCLWFAGLTGALALTTGLNLETIDESNYAPQSLALHRQAAFFCEGALLVALALEMLAHRSGRASLRFAYRFTLALAGATVPLVGHLGGMLTHGDIMAAVWESDVAANGPSLATNRQVKPLSNAEIPSVGTSVDFRHEIWPILEANCVRCHKSDNRKGGLSLESKQAILRGGKSGPAVVSGNSEKSLILQLSRGDIPNKIMPRKGKRLSAQEIASLKKWIDTGLPWEDQSKSTKLIQTPILDLKGPNPIDTVLETYLKEREISLDSVIDDQSLIRRTYLDLIGLLPPPQDSAAFLKDSRPFKQQRLIRNLLERKHDYAAHWISFWNDALRNDYQGVGFIDGGRKQITSWLYRSLFDNKPYDQLARELIIGAQGAEGFIQGIQWRGTNNPSESTPIQAAQNVARVFQGVDLRCATCHDSFTSKWKQTDTYGLATFFSPEPLKIFRCDKSTDKTAESHFLFPSLMPRVENASLEGRRALLAIAISRPENSRFPRIIVNRIWAMLMGHPLAELNYDSDENTWNDQLLDYLSNFFIEHDYNLKDLIALISSSKTYALPRSNKSGSAKYEFRGPEVKKLSAEQFVDALYQLSEAWPKKAGTNFAQFPLPGNWIWNDSNALQAATVDDLNLRKIFTLRHAPRLATAYISCDNEYTLYVNEKLISSGNNWFMVGQYEFSKLLTPGQNKIVIVAKNSRIDGFGQPMGVNPAGCYFYALLETTDAETPNIDIESDASWEWSPVELAKQPDRSGASNSWQKVAVLGNSTIAPWNLWNQLVKIVPYRLPLGQVWRAGLQSNSELQSALGRPSREHVVLSRNTSLSILPALELSTGETLEKLLEMTSVTLLEKFKGQTSELVRQLYQALFSREPHEHELITSLDALGKHPSTEKLQDLLWALIMQPEFLFIN